jgi:hypothetical protein
MPAWLAYDGAAQVIESRAEVVASLGHGGAVRLRPSVDDDACRLPFRMRIDDSHRRRHRVSR